MPLAHEFEPPTICPSDRPIRRAAPRAHDACVHDSNTRQILKRRLDLRLTVSNPNCEVLHR
jgi:hypothetical protein